MYTVIIRSNWHGYEFREECRTLKQAEKKWASWYAHSLDYIGQLSETFNIYDKDGKCIKSDRF